MANSYKLTVTESAPRPSGCRKLKGGVNEWRIRIGDYRVIYTIQDTTKMARAAAQARTRLREGDG